MVGDSRTGETQKYDGPYYVIRWLLAPTASPFLPMVGDTHRTRLNLVPRDFVIAAIADLSGRPEARWARSTSSPTPSRSTIDEVLTAVAKTTGRTIVRVPLPVGARQGGDRPRARGLPADADPVVVRSTTSSTRPTTTPPTPRADLAEAGIGVPPLRGLPADPGAFFKQHPEIASEAMV